MSTYGAQFHSKAKPSFEDARTTDYRFPLLFYMLGSLARPDRLGKYDWFNDLAVNLYDRLERPPE